ncbi:hypothetical protein [Arundinibacter roseus]|uniref:hypothetical protein n=1 Tax=Arundinibacter roseus TaxID=2070510 RepID=UPI001405564F|nr:hypothetical protein [Arundinibacter roseus]
MANSKNVKKQNRTWRILKWYFWAMFQLLLPLPTFTTNREWKEWRKMRGKP